MNRPDFSTQHTKVNQKKVLALVLAFACAFTMFAGAAFTDDADIQTADAVNTLVALGVINGYTDGSFKPDATVTRAEMAKMIFTILNGGNDDASAYANLPSSFKDLTDDWYKGYIKYLQNSGIIAGKSATEFAPEETVTGVEAAKMMLVAAGYSADKAGLTGSAWAVNTMKYANANSLFAKVDCDVNAALPRQFAAQLLCNSLDMENVVYSKDIEGFKPATDVSEDRTIGGKYMDLVTYEGVLSGSGSFRSAGTDKITMVTVDKVNGSKADASKYSNMKWDYAEDATALVGQYVKVMTGKNEKVFGVTNVPSQNKVVTAALSDIKKISGTKVKVDGTEYKYSSSAALYGFTADTTISVIGGTSANSADTITFISNDGDETFDVAYIDPIAEVAKVTYVSEESFTAGGTSYEFDEVIAPSDLAKDEYVVVSTDRFTGDTKFEKADKVSGKVTATKGTAPITDISVDGTWYKVAAANPNSTSIPGENLVGLDPNADTLALDSTYDLVVVNGVVYNATKTAIGSSNTAMVTGFSSAFDTDGHMQAKLMFADGTEKVVPTDDVLSANVVSQTAGQADKAFVTYTIDDGVYEIDKLNNLASGNDGSVKDVFGSSYTHATATPNDDTAFNASTDKLDGKRVAEDAVIYVHYMDGTDAKSTVITGAKLNDMASSFGDEVAYVYDGNVIVAAVIVGNTYLPGASDSKLYGYITSDIVDNNNNGVSYKSFDVWTSEGESVSVKMKASVAVAKGDLISFELAEDNFIEGVKSESARTLTTVTASIKQVGSGYVLFHNDDASKTDYKLSDDVQYLYLNTKDVAGVNGGELAKADKNTVASDQRPGKTAYYNNVKYVLDGNNEIVMIAIDVKLNKWDSAGSTYVS